MSKPITTTVEELEEEIFAQEGVRIVIRAPLTTRVVTTYKAAYERGLGNDRTLALLIARIDKIMGAGAYGVTAVLGNGQLANPKMLLRKIRDSYVAK